MKREEQLRFTFHVSRFTVHVSRFTVHVSRPTLVGTNQADQVNFALGLLDLLVQAQQSHQLLGIVRTQATKIEFLIGQAQLEMIRFREHLNVLQSLGEPMPGRSLEANARAGNKEIALARRAEMLVLDRYGFGGHRG